VKEALIERIEDFIEMVVTPLGSAETLGSPGTANMLGLAGDCLAILESFIAMVVGAVDGFLVDFCDENMRNRVQYRLRRALEQIRQAYMQFALAETYRRIQRNESAELDAKLRDRSPRPQCTVFFLKNLNDVFSH
jgi:hypothetical protein